MASASGHVGAERRSGGKILRPRRSLRARTPYDRPELPDSHCRRNPSWISKFVYHPTRVLAASAGRVLSFVFGSDSSSSSSSSDTDSDGDFDESIDGAGISSPKDEDLMKASTPSLQYCHEQDDTQPVVQKTETKHVIEELLMQETFLREEGERLTNIIKSRVSDQPMVASTSHGSLNRVSNNPLGTEADGADTAAKIVLEWTKSLDENKWGSELKRMLKYGTEDNVASPVYVAKSYMRTRPPWASPSINFGEFRSQSPAGMRLLKEDTPSWAGGSSFSSGLASFSAKSWSIQEEIRKVKSKATDDMLRNLSSPQIDWSPSSLEHVHRPDTMQTQSNMRNVQDEFQNEASPIINASVSNHNKFKDAEAIPTNEKTGGADDESGSVILALGAIPGSTGMSPRQKDVNRPSSSARPEDNLKSETSGRGTSRASTEEKCEFLSETLIEIPIFSENEFPTTRSDDTVATGSRSSSPGEHGRLSVDLSQPSPKSVKKETAKKVARHMRRHPGRGRGRGRHQGPDQ